MLPARLTHGRRTDVTVEVAGSGPDGVAVSVGDATLWLVGPPGGPVADVDREAGARYRLEGVVPFDPGFVREVERWVETGDGRCPECGGPVGYRPAVDRAGVPEAPERALLVADGDTSIERADGDDGRRVDDWRGGMNEGAGPVERLRAEDAPGTFVCEDCGAETDPADLRRDAGVTGPDAGTTAAGAPTTSHAMHSVGSVDASAAVDDIGMATGGAKDAANFRDNVEEGYVPRPDALSVEGLFYDYYFETGEGAPDDEDALFYPTYAAAVSEDPLAGETERYLAVGLNSTLTPADFERKRLNLVAVLDVSGSMSSPFDQYYYDRHGRRREADAGGDTKMAAAREALVALTTHLADDDRFGVVLYNSRAHVAKPLRAVGRTDMDAIRGHVRDVEAGGGTDMSAGFRAARELLAEGADAGPDVENRIVFMTDAMPNLGELDEGGLVDLVEEAAADGIHTTFVGMGLDANAELIDALSAVRGANHYFVHSAEEFERRLGEEFAFMVTPLAFELSLDLVADGYRIEAVHGSPNADAATGEVMHAATLFPSPARDGRTRGGVVLLELERTGADPELELVASWEERDGSRRRHAETVEFPRGPEHFDDDGVRKAVLLARYADLLEDWMRAVRDDGGEAGEGDGDGREDAVVDDWEPMEPGREPSEWEQESVPLAVPAEYAELFRAFREHLVAEMEALGDDDLQQEVEVLDRLLAAADGA